MKKIALKRLTKSDLTFFLWHHRNSGGGNQKAINLNADVLVKLMYPSLPDEAAKNGDRFLLSLDIFGPNGAGCLNQARKIIRGETYKNWRLNGELIFDQELRFQPLRQGDFAVIEFDGDAFPVAIRMVLISKEMQLDEPAHAELDAWLGKRRMARISPDELDTLVAKAGLSDAHPLSGINVQADLEDASQGGLEATRRLFKRSTTRKISKTELKAARNRADETGVIGEEFVNEWLTDERTAGRVKGFEWVSRDNAIAPYDFTVTPSAEPCERLDVKATSGAFRNALHMSINELLHCADEAVPYRIYRVFAIDGCKAKMRISEPLATFAKGIVPILEKLPAGVWADSVSIDPTNLPFGPDIELELNPDGDE